jgi:hypothetical protein
MGQFSKNYRNFLPKILSISSQKYGFGIRGPGSEIRDPEKTYSGSRIPDLGVKKAPDPGSRIRIRNTAFRVWCLSSSVVHVQGSFKDEQPTP